LSFFIVIQRTIKFPEFFIAVIVVIVISKKNKKLNKNHYLQKVKKILMMNSALVNRRLFEIEDATPQCIIKEFNKACEANMKKEGEEESRCLGCNTPIVQPVDQKRKRFHCGVNCVGVTSGLKIKALVFVTYYALPLTSAVRVRSLSFDGIKVILSFLYDKHLGHEDMATKWGKIEHTVLFKRKMINN